MLNLVEFRDTMRFSNRKVLIRRIHPFIALFCLRSDVHLFGIRQSYSVGKFFALPNSAQNLR